MTIDALLMDRGYEVLHQLGEGSGGQVYKSVQRSTGQVVAVKILSLLGLHGDVRERRLARFRREIALCSRLYHPDIVRLLDSGQLDDSRHFAVFEFIPGLTLGDLLLDAKTLPVQRACNLMIQLLAPLAYAHGLGIFHRDLKPANIMVVSDGERDRIKVLDFGISIGPGAEYGSKDRLTLTHEWVGTPAYAAPEQLGGEPGSPKSDIYAWGLVLVECLTGIPLVGGNSIPEIIRRQLVPEPHRLPGSLGASRLGALLSSVLDKNPDRRLGDAKTVLSMLHAVPLGELEDGQGYLRDAGESPPSARHTSETLTDEPRPQQVEHRHATVVACRVFFTGIGQPSSIEHLDIAILEASSHIREIMNQFGANMSESFGEVTISHFGISRSSDSDATLALRASLEVTSRLDGSAPWLRAQGLKLHVRIGLHNGPVTIQRVEGNRRKIDGVTAGVANALASMNSNGHPEASRILASEEFRALAKRHAHFLPFAARAPVSVPWAAQPLSIYEVRAPLAAATSRNYVEPSPFVGRMSEIEALQSAWQGSRTAMGLAIVLRGEAGVGKTRLIAEFGRLLRAEGTGWMETRCLPEWQQGFLRPLALLLRGVLGVSGLDASAASAELERQVETLGVPGPEAIPLLCDWLLIPKPPAYASPAWSPQKRRAMLHEVVAATLAAFMEGGGVILIEDLHWADPSTLECLDVVIQRAAERRTFLLLTTRSRENFDWEGRVTNIQLNGLDLGAASELVRALIPEVASSSAARLAERCDGVPLYVEELASAFTAAMGVEKEADARSAVLRTGTVPPSLRDLLMSRLDDVGDAKQVAQFAAAVGREQSLDVLVALMGKPQFELLGDLEQLVSARLLTREDNTGTLVYVFRHALIRDAAYDSMSRADRIRIHTRIAEGFENGFPDVVETQPDTLAHHWERCGDAERSVRYLLLAAQQAAIASAHVEAIAGLDHGLSLVGQLPPSAVRARLEAELVLAKGAAIVAKRGYTDPEAASSFERASSLLPPRGETLHLAFAARWGLWYFRNTQANLQESSRLARELESIAIEANDDTLSLNAFHALCLTNFSLGRLDDASEASHGTRDKYDFEQHRNLCTVRGDDPHLACLSWGAIADMFRGRHDDATRRMADALALAERLGYPSLKAGVHANAAWLLLIWGTSGASVAELELSRKHAKIAIDLANEHGFPFWTLYGSTIDNAARASLGELEAAQTLIHGINIWRGAGAELGLCFHFAFAADAFRRAGQYELALNTLAQGLEHCDKHDSRFFEAELHRLRAEALLDSRNPGRDINAARAECSAGLQAATNCGSDWWALGIHVTLNRCPETATPADRAGLQRVVERFPVGPQEPPLLREARQLLKVLN